MGSAPPPSFRPPPKAHVPAPNTGCPGVGRGVGSREGLAGALGATREERGDSKVGKGVTGRGRRVCGAGARGGGGQPAVRGPGGAGMPV